MARYRIYFQLSELQETALASVQLCSSPSHLQCALQVRGPPETPYELGTFLIKLRFQDDYPYTPPEVQFVTPILHCNVSDEGDFCHSSLCSDWDCTRTIKWLTEKILVSMACPDLKNPSSRRKELVQLYRTNVEKYRTAVSSFTVLHGLWDSN